jgi:hypothetical protein
MLENTAENKPNTQALGQQIPIVDTKNITDINDLCKKITKEKIQNLLQSNSKIKLILEKIFTHYSTIFVKAGFSIEEVNDSNLRTTLINIINPMLESNERQSRIDNVLNLL